MLRNKDVIKKTKCNKSTIFICYLLVLPIFFLKRLHVHCTYFFQIGQQNNEIESNTGRVVDSNDFF